jgi:hypothetical protein
VKSLEQLNKLKNEMKEILKIREGIPSETHKAHVMVCGGAGVFPRTAWMLLTP